MFHLRYPVQRSLKPLATVSRIGHHPWTRSFSSNRAALEQRPSPTQSVSSLAPIGVAAAIQAATDPAVVPRPKIFDELSLKDRAGIVSGGNSGLGLEMALALCEAGAAIYCFDLPTEPSKEWKATQDYVKRLENGSRLEYVCGDVTDQQGMWDKVKKIGDQEGRMDICIAAAGIAKKNVDCLEYPAKQFKEVHDVNTNGVLYTAQAAGRQMIRFGNNGSIILIASISGSITNWHSPVISYNTSKSAVLQMGRSMACELGVNNIRVNTISPGYIRTPLTEPYIEKDPEILGRWSSQNPMGRIGRPDELRGVAVWLASDASSFCTGSDIFVSGGHQSW